MNHIEIVTEFADSDGDLSSTAIRIPNETTVAGVEGFTQAWVAAIEGMTRGLIRSVFAVLRPNPSSVAGNTLVPQADVEQIGKFQFNTEANTRVNVNLPTLREAVGIGFGFDEIDQEDDDVAAFITAMIDGIDVGAVTLIPCDVGEMPVDTIIFAREAFRNSGARS